MKLALYSETQLRLVYRVLAWNNTRSLWAPIEEAPEVPIGKEVIRDAVARALFDADENLMDALAWSPMDGRPQPCDGPVYLARRIQTELTRAGWQMKIDRTHLAADVRARMSLEDHILFGINLAGRSTLKALGSVDRVEAQKARAIVVEKICETLTMMKVILGRKRSG